MGTVAMQATYTIILSGLGFALISGRKGMAESNRRNKQIGQMMQDGTWVSGLDLEANLALQEAEMDFHFAEASGLVVADKATANHHFAA